MPLKHWLEAYLFSFPTTMSHEHEHTHATGKNAKMAGFWTFIKDLEKLWDEYLVQNAPFEIPTNIKDVLVQAAPYITIILLIIMLPAVIAALGISWILAVLAPFAGFLAIVSLLLVIFGFVLKAMAIKPLFARSKKWWDLVFYSTLVGFVSSLLSGSIVWGIIALVIGLYVLFQIKSYYK